MTPTTQTRKGGLARDLFLAALFVAVMGAVDRFGGAPRSEAGEVGSAHGREAASDKSRWRENDAASGTAAGIALRSPAMLRSTPAKPQLSTVELLKLYEAEGAGGTDGAWELREGPK